MWQEIENLCGVMFCYIGAVCFRGGNGMERKQGIGFRLGACALKNAERRMPRVQNMRSGEENTQVTIHALVKGVTNFYGRESNCGVIESPMAWNKQDHTLSVTGVIGLRYKLWEPNNTLDTNLGDYFNLYFIMVEVVIYLQIYWLFWNVFHI